MSEASSYHHNYHGHPDTRYYADPGEQSSSSVRRNRYDRDSTRRIRDVSWVSSQQSPSSTNDPYARWYPPPPDPADLSTPAFSGQPLPIAQSSPMMGRTPSPDMRMPSPMIGEYMTVEGPGDEEEELPEDDGEIDFDFSNAPQQRGSKGARRWIGGFVKGLRNFPGLRKSPQRPSPSGDFVSSIDAHHENDVQFPTISSLRLRPLTPTGIAQTAELMEMPQPLVYPQPSPQHTYQQPHVHRPPPPAPSSPVYAPGADVVPQVLSTVDERSSEQTGTHEIHPHPHSSVDHTHSHHTHSPRTHTHAHSHSQHSHSHSQPHLHSHLHSQSHSSTVQPAHPNTTFTVTDYVTVPPPQWPSPPPSTRIKRFLRNLDQLPWVENEQIVDAYFPGRSSRHRRHPDSPVDDGKPAASWYNKRHNSLPREMGAGPSASLMYGWPPQMQKAYSHQGIVYSQFPYGYTPVQPAFVYPTTFPPPGTH